MQAKQPRYHANKALNATRNPHEAIIVPSVELEVDNEKFFESARVLFTDEQIEDFKKIHSYKQFREYCEANDLVVMF